jgi:hypothetical protein
MSIVKHKEEMPR